MPPSRSAPRSSSASDSEKAATRFLAVGALGALFVLFSQTPDYPSALILIGVVGSAHALCRAFLDGLLLEVCDSSLIGRVRSNVNSLLSAVSLAVFGLSSLVTAGSIRAVFAGVGVGVALSCALLYVRSFRVPTLGALSTRSQRSRWREL